MMRHFLRRHRRARIRELARMQFSTREVGINSAEIPGLVQARVKNHFAKGNPWRWQAGQTGNPRGRPSKVDLCEQHILTLLDLIGRVTALEWRRSFQQRREERWTKFKVLYGLTENAHRSALIAGYSPKTAKSKAYLLARRARDAE